MCCEYFSTLIRVKKRYHEPREKEKIKSESNKVAFDAWIWCLLLAATSSYFIYNISFASSKVFLRSFRPHRTNSHRRPMKFKWNITNGFWHCSTVRPTDSSYSTLFLMSDDDDDDIYYYCYCYCEWSMIVQNTYVVYRVHIIIVLVHDAATICCFSLT